MNKYNINSSTSICLCRHIFVRNEFYVQIYINSRYSSIVHIIISLSTIMLLSRLIPVALLAFSSEVLCTSLHNWWVFPEEAGNVKEIKSSIRVPHGSDPEHTYWMANGFNQGMLQALTNAKLLSLKISF